ncbi:multiheme c-type cytochrome [Paracoccus benzoatiresistens]|uniref:Multiheme c-type cytochrome n=1 Tax=Paracoccus benzoatiresistens TaxID=2997341 RepID=A0ABT4J5F5_9RHOB|nr:multiheme c-type cytochrome [Paracoccus sp. EF6]MCZ0962358.1 multiheme c-type cytochrome [Paracoccus sp. EF6]
MRLQRTLIAATFALLPAAGLAAETTAPAFVGSAACTGCHEAVAADWKGSHHALAWTEPSPGTVATDFDGTAFEGAGMSVRFRIEDGRYYADVTESDGARRSYPVHSVVGVEPLQQYLFETEPGRLQSFDVVWDTEKGGWFHLYGDDVIPPDDGLHWTGPYKTWNARCAECHATGYRKNYDPATRTYASRQVEIGVGCEACHGPGGDHLAWAERWKTTGEPLPPTGGFTVDLADTEATIQQCATCHSRREAQGDGNPLPGTAYHDAFTLALLRPGQYHADGQILDEVYEYGSFLQSKMYAAGVGCTDCHKAHTATLRAEGNAVCAQCHSPAGNPRFPTLTPADYDSPAHHFHDQGSKAAQCKSCHMVERVYMGNDWRADHSFRVPRPDLAADTGAPDACTACHSDRTPPWAAATLEAWFPDSRHRIPHYGQVLAWGRADPIAAGGDLGTLAGDSSHPGIVRATALWLAAQGADAALAGRLAPLLEDADPLVRAFAVQVQRAAPPTERVSRLVPLLSDPMLSVRIEAAKQMVDAPIARLPPAMEKAYRRAMGDWQAALGTRMDFPETHMVLGSVALATRNIPAAESAFREVTRLDPQRAEAWIMLVRLAAATSGDEAARQVLTEALAAVPKDRTLRGFEAELAAAAQVARP